MMNPTMNWKRLKKKPLACEIGGGWAHGGWHRFAASALGPRLLKAKGQRPAHEKREKVMPLEPCVRARADANSYYSTRHS